MDGLSGCHNANANMHSGEYSKKVAFGQTKSTKNCANSFDGDDFDDGIPNQYTNDTFNTKAHPHKWQDAKYDKDTNVKPYKWRNATGNSFTFSWVDEAKVGDWCYINQALPDGYSGGLILNYTLADDASEFVLRLTTDPKPIYFDNKSIKKYNATKAPHATI